MSRPMPDGYQAVIGRAAQIAEARWNANRRAVWRLERAEIEDADAAVWWLLDQAGDGGLVWRHKTPEELRTLACWLLWQRYRFRREFEDRRGEP